MTYMQIEESSSQVVIKRVSVLQVHHDTGRQAARPKTGDYVEIILIIGQVQAELRVDALKSTKMNIKHLFYHDRCSR